MHTIPNKNTTTKLLARIVRVVLSEGQFASSDGLREAVTARCRVLGLPHPKRELEDAIDLVGSNTRLFQQAERRPHQPVMEHPSELSKVDAHAALARVFDELAKRAERQS